MRKKEFKNLLQGVRELKAAMRGNLIGARELELTPSQVRSIRKHKGPRPSPAFIAAKVRSIRRRLGLSQSQFAAMLRVPKSTLQNWEQGRRKPEGPALALLIIAERAPAAVLEALHRKSA